VVEDDNAIRRCVSEALELAGHDVVATTNGAEALAVLDTAPRVPDTAAWRPDVILLDLRMPIMSGWEFTSRYRAQPGPHAPLVVMTATHDPYLWAADVAADAVLPKPFELEHLLDIVAGCTARTRAATLDSAVS